MRFIDVVVDVPAVGDRRFTYSVPEAVALPTGAKVRVPFGRGEADAFIAGDAGAPSLFTVKPVKALYDIEFMPTPHLLELAGKVAAYYCAPLSAAWSCLWPPVAPKRKIEGAASMPPLSVAGGGTGVVDARRSESHTTLVWGGKEFRWAHYILSAREARERGRGVLFLVPEVKGIEDAAVRLERVFPGEVARLHSEQAGVARRTAYLSLIRGEKSIALGTRSAVFAPLKGIGTVILEDEPAESYKSPDLPFYDSRTVARMRASIEGCRVVLGSSHPSVDAYWEATEALNGKVGLVVEPARPAALESTRGPGDVACVGPGALDSASIVDLRATKRGKDILSQPLAERLRGTFESGGKAILFLNRRGDSSQVTCQGCGNVLACPRCGIPFAYHAKDSLLVCHTCGRREQAPETCPSCGGFRWKFGGVGIERADSELKRVFPGVPVYRMDQDISRDRPAAAELSSFSRCEGPACLLATRMLLGFPDIPAVATVGVLTCDTLLNLPDFRAAEKVFHLLWSLRELALPASSGGAFIVQTYNPDHSGIRGVACAQAFYRDELEGRRLLGYPPHRQLVKVRFIGRVLDRVRESAERFVKVALAEEARVDVLGPGPAPKPRIRGEHRWQAALRGSDRGVTASLCRKAMDAAAQVPGVKVSADVDPVDMA